MTTPLSERELQILRLVAEGFSNRQIAGMLDISENTVKVHVRKIFNKIHVASRTEATMYAVRNGLIADLPVAEAPVTVDEPHISEPSTTHYRYRWFVVGVLMCLAIGGLIWWQTSPVYQVSTPVERAPEGQRWAQLAPLPQPVDRMFIATVAGQLYVIRGNQPPKLMRYDASQDVWLPEVDLPIDGQIGMSWHDATGLWLYEETAHHIWMWDGRTWQMMYALPTVVTPSEMVRVAGEIALLDATHQQMWINDGTDDELWQAYSLPMTLAESAQLVVVDDVLYVLGDGRNVWRSLDQGRTWNIDGTLTQSWQGGVAIPVLDALLLMRDESQSVYTLSVGEGVTQRMPVALNAMVAATIWQTMVVFVDPEQGNVNTYQFMFQSFMPMMQ